MDGAFQSRAPDATTVVAAAADPAEQPEAMVTIPSFDGSCSLSQDADLFLKFDDGSTLKCHSALLSVWSGVLKEAISIPHGGEIKLPGSSCRSWRIILAMMYPTDFKLQNISLNVDLLTGLAVEADKYAITSVKAKVEEELNRLPCTEANALQWAAFATRTNMQRLLKKCLPVVSSMLLQCRMEHQKDRPAQLLELGKESLVDLLANTCVRLKQSLSDQKQGQLVCQFLSWEQKDKDELEEEHDDTMEAIAAAGCYISKKNTLCEQNTKRPVREMSKRLSALEAKLRELEEELLNVKYEHDEVMIAIDSAGCYISKKNTLCEYSTKRPCKELLKKWKSADQEFESLQDELDRSTENYDRELMELRYELDKVTQERNDVMEAIGQAGCFISKRGNLCKSSTNRPVST